MPKTYKTIGLGGTFDRFHVGHKHFLEFSAALADKILVGITVPELSARKKAAELIEPYETRKNGVEQFFKEKNITGETFPLTDSYGPTIQNSQVDAVAVTEETVAGAEAINQKRDDFGLPALPVHICNLLKDSTGEFISSTRIRLGQINRQGDSYFALTQNGLKLTPEQIQFFRAPQGPVVLTTDPSYTTGQTFLVGDIVTETFLKEGWPFNLAVFDRKSMRQSYYSLLLEERLLKAVRVHVSNPAGQITPEVIQWAEAYCAAVGEDKDTGTIFLEINGEEDLLTVILVLLASLATRIYYGQPNEGMVELIVTEELKEKFRAAVTPAAA